jgi:hypothetical protein
MDCAKCRMQNAECGLFSATTSGRADTSSRPLVEMKRASESTSETKNCFTQQLDRLELKIS